MGNTLYRFGQIQAYIGVVVALLICMSMTGSGVTIVVRKPSFTESTTGVVSNVVCTSNLCTAGNTRVILESNTWDVPNLTYPPPLVENANVTVYYSKDTPPKFASSTDVVPKGYGYSLIGSGVCIFLIAILFAYFIFSSRIASQVYGGVGALDLVGRSILSI